MNIIIGFGVSASVVIATCYFDRIIECCKGKRKNFIPLQQDGPPLLERDLGAPQIDPKSSAAVTTSTVIDLSNPEDPITKDPESLRKYIVNLEQTEHFFFNASDSYLENIKTNLRYTNIARSIELTCAYSAMVQVEIRMIGHLDLYIKDYTSSEKNQPLLSELKLLLSRLVPFYQEKTIVSLQIKTIIDAIEKLENRPTVPSHLTKNEDELCKYLQALNTRPFDASTAHSCPLIQEIYEILCSINDARLIWENDTHLIKTPKGLEFIDMGAIEMKIVSYFLTYNIDKSYQSHKNSLFLKEFKNLLNNMLQYHQNDPFEKDSINTLLRII